MNSLILTGAVIVFLFIVMTVVLVGVGIINYVQPVVDQELNALELLRKYEWFKDASAQLDKKQADLKAYQSRLISLKNSYEGISRVEWSREDRQQYNLWESEIAGVKASYNSLAAEYNSQMVKINWSFANQGSLPQGATNPLPREYKPYQE